MGCAQCGRVIKAKQLCSKHYQLLRWEQDPSKREREIELHKQGKARRKAGIFQDRSNEGLWEFVKEELGL